MYTFFLFFSILTIGSAQEFSFNGTIQDGQTGEALIGATVFIPELNIGTTTDLDGAFTLTLTTGQYQVNYSYLGYEGREQWIDLDADLKKSIFLQPESQTLDEVVVTATVKDENVEQASLGVEKLETSVIKQLPAILGEVDIIKSIQLLPGVSSVGEGSSGFNVRGGAADQNLVLLDDAIIYNPSRLLGFFSVFNADAVEDVQLYKGSIPAKYGGRLSSVLEVRQRDGDNRKFRGSAGIGLISSRIALEGPIAKGDKAEGNGSWLITGRRSYADLFLNFSEELSDNTLFFYDLNAKANYRLGKKDRLYLSGYFGQDRLGFTGLFGLNWGNAAASIRWNHLFNDKLSGDLMFTYSRYNYSLQNLAPGTEFEWSSNIENYTIHRDMNWFVNSRNTLKFGFQSIYYNFRPGQINPVDDSPIAPVTFDPKFALEFGLYVNNEQTLTDRLSINYGLRFSGFNRMGRETIQNYENDQPITQEPGSGIFQNGEITGETSFDRGESISLFTGWEPRFSARYRIDDQSSIKAGYNRMYQYIHLISNSASATPLDIWTPSGPYIEPQRSDQIGLGYFRNFRENEYEFSAEVYYKWMDNLIDFVDGAELIFNNNLETEVLSGTGRAYGLELQLSKTQGDFTGWISYTYSRTERLIQGINNSEYYPANFDKPHDLSITGMYQWSDRLSFSANFVYATGQPLTFPNGRYTYSGLTVANYGTRNQDRLPDYHRLDLSATLKGKKRERFESQWVFSIYNAYNRLNANSILFQEQNSDASGQEVATGVTEAVRLSYFGAVPSVSYEIKF